MWVGADVVFLFEVAIMGALVERTEFLSEVLIMGALVERTDDKYVGTKILLVLTVLSTVLAVGYPVGEIVLSVSKLLAVVGASEDNDSVDGQCVVLNVPLVGVSSSPSPVGIQYYHHPKKWENRTTRCLADGEWESWAAVSKRVLVKVPTRCLSTV